MKQMSQLGKMFVFIALRQLYSTTNKKIKPLKVDELNESTSKLVVELVNLGVVKTSMNAEVRISEKGGKLVVKYFTACADQLRDAQFGKFTWSKRSKFHKELMARIA